MRQLAAALHTKRLRMLEALQPQAAGEKELMSCCPTVLDTIKLMRETDDV